MIGVTFLSMAISVISAFEYRKTSVESLFPFTSAANFYGSPTLCEDSLSINSYKGFGITTSAGRPYNDENLLIYFTGVKYSDKFYGLQATCSSFGTDFYKENRYSLYAAYNFFDIFNAGVCYNFYQISFKTEEISAEKRFNDIDFALSLSPFNFLTIACLQNSILTEFTSKNKKELYPERSAGIILKPAKGFGLTWNITDSAAGYINSFTINILPLSNILIKAGYTPEDSRFAASLLISIKKFTISYTFGFHPFLGYSHNFGITFAPSEYENANYIEFKAPPVSSVDKAININRASLEELNKIPELSETSSKRIISYREKIGPITEKSLIQIGLTREEIESVKNHCYGFARDNEFFEETAKSSPAKSANKKEASKKAHIPAKEKIKEKFQALIEAGIPATIAIKYSELSVANNRINFESTLKADKSLSEEQRETIRRICFK